MQGKLPKFFETPNPMQVRPIYYIRVGRERNEISAPLELIYF
jgi:hypothetical protein